MKKIIIDCRYLKMSGIGRFLEGILNNFDFKSYDVTLIGKSAEIEKYKDVKYLSDDTNPFSSKTILKWDKVKNINSNDIYFSPNFIIPYGIKIKCFTVLHDIIFLDMKDVNKNYLEYHLKKMLLKRCLKKSGTVFTVSKFSKNRIIHYFKKYGSKVIYEYNGVMDNFKNYSKKQEKEKYVIFVGNIKKHKGLKTLLNAIPYIDEDINIKIVGDSSSFRNGDKDVVKMLNNDHVEFTGKISDEKLLDLIAKAKYLVLPSMYEGFGLPPLEALYLNTQPIVSDIEVFKEIYGDLPVKFFKLNDGKDLARLINQECDNFKIDKEYLNNKFSFKKYAKLIENKFNG